MVDTDMPGAKIHIISSGASSFFVSGSSSWSMITAPGSGGAIFKTNI